GLLANDTDADGDPLIAVLDFASFNGSLNFHADGSFRFVPDPGFSGTTTFTYHASDGSDSSNVATVTITVIRDDTPTPTLTNTPTDTPTNTPRPTETSIPTDVPTDTPTNTPIPPTDTPSNTPTTTPTPTDTPTATPTDTPPSTADVAITKTASPAPATAGTTPTDILTG